MKVDKQRSSTHFLELRSCDSRHNKCWGLLLHWSCYGIVVCTFKSLCAELPLKVTGEKEMPLHGQLPGPRQLPARYRLLPVCSVSLCVNPETQRCSSCPLRNIPCQKSPVRLENNLGRPFLTALLLRLAGEMGALISSKY